METQRAGPPSGPRVHVGPRADPRIADAVRAGGGTVVDAAHAEAIVWLGSDPDALRAVLHDGVRWVQLHSAGVERWIRSGVVTGDRTVTSAAGAYADAVAEHVIGLLLAGVHQLHRYARAGTWHERDDMRPLRGATVAVIGAGGIGRAVIRALDWFDVDVIAVNRSGRAVPGAARVGTADDLHDVWPRADAVVLAAPATAATAALVDRAALAAMRRHAVLVNIARGPLVDTAALVAALADGQIGTAALDVTEPEPLPDDHPLWREPRCLITPHAANFEAVRRPALADHVRRNVARFAAGRDLLARVHPERGY